MSGTLAAGRRAGHRPGRRATTPKAQHRDRDQGQRDRGTASPAPLIVDTAQYGRNSPPDRPSARAVGRSVTSLDTVPVICPTLG
ncbi:hypothetical protein [Streptomyces sp. NPDC008150]|uniref:hypothetical protein n=1 Tax=Streptomyces sp. NPDC008150 TaxID=3364816 RepID=UPI0036E0A5BC